MDLENDPQVKKGRMLFTAIVTISIILQLAPDLLTTNFLVSRLVFPIAGVILYSFLVYKTYQGYKWARITLVVAYLASLVFSIRMVFYLVSFRQGWELTLIAYEVLPIFFAIFAAIALLRSKSLIAFVESNQIHPQESPQLADSVSGADIVNKSKVFPRLKNVHVHQVVLAVGVFILFTQYIWKLLYVGGILPGVYWLFYYLDEWYFASIKFTFISAGVIFLLWLLSRFFVKEFSTQLIKLVGALTVTGAAIILTFPMVIARHTVFVEKLYAEDKVFYLSAYPMFAEVNYSVAECELTGQFCRTIFVSGDITNTNWRNSELKYDEDTKEIILLEDEEGIIFSKVLQ